MESSCFDSIKVILQRKFSEQTQKMENYYKTVNKMKKNSKNSNYKMKNCPGNKIQDHFKFGPKNELYRCYPKTNEMKDLKKLKTKMNKLEKITEGMVKTCRNFFYNLPFDKCVTTKIHNVDHQIVWIQFEFTNKLNNMVVNSDNCASTIDKSFVRSINENLISTKNCIYNPIY